MDFNNHATKHPISPYRFLIFEVIFTYRFLKIGVYRHPVNYQ
jgi:hypothetical protein